MPSSTLNQPRDWLETPTQFGKTATPKWRPSPRDRRKVAYWQAARLQHEVVVMLNGHVNMRRTTWRKMAPDVESVGYTQLMRVLRGEAEMSMTLLLELSHIFGPTLTYSPDMQKVFGEHGVLGPEFPA